MRRLFRHHRRPGIWFRQRRRQLEPHCGTPSRRAFGGGSNARMIRVVLPGHLRALARAGAEVQLHVDGPVTQRSVLDALEAQYPMLRGTIRDHVTQERRPFLRFFACEEDYSLEPPDTPLPDAIASGKEPLRIIGRIVKPMALGNDEPMRRNSPTVKDLVVQDERDLGTERERLCGLINRFAAAGPKGCTTHPHSFFGRLTPEDWATLMYKHLDHHLRQFGV